MTRRDPAVAIVGAGMSGLCVAIALLRNGITDVTLYEKADEVGGTWRDNTYPGLTCDVPSRVYQYTFATKPNWTHVFSPGGEIQAYFRGIVDEFALQTNTPTRHCITSGSAHRRWSTVFLSSWSWRGRGECSAFRRIARR
jgi:cation diffusion facilitator CzcD-associated flavoprotein CzcO